MEEIKKGMALLCGMAVFRTALCLLLPDGSIKRFAQFGFAVIQSVVLMRLTLQMTQWLLGVLV